MGKWNVVLLAFLLLVTVRISAQSAIKFADTDGLILSKERRILEKSIEYEASFFSSIFPERKVNIAEIKFFVAANFLEFVRVQAKFSSSIHAWSSGFFSPKDTTLVVYKDKKMSSADFLSTCYHELSHAFLSLYTPQYTPPWFNEGLAEYLQCMTFGKNEIVQQVNRYNINRVKTLIELKDLNLLEFVQWDYQKFSTESFSQESYGYAVAYSMVLFLMQKDGTKALEIFRNLVGKYSSVEMFDHYYDGGFANFEKEFGEYILRF